MPLQLTKEGMRAMFPVSPEAIVNAFVAKQSVLAKAGILDTPRRCAWFFANVEHESGGFSIKNLTENINYTHQRVAEVWPNRFNRGRDAMGRLIPDSSKVIAKFGNGPGWQLRAFDEIYGNRMGNRPGTSDGSTFIGRGGPQWTGRDGYEALARYLSQLIPGLGKITAEQAVAYATKPEYQPEVCVAFWMWKNLNRLADANNWIGLVTAWNGGTNGMADRNQRLAGNDPHIKRMKVVDRIAEPVQTLPEKPKPAPVPKPPAKPASNASTAGGAVVAGGAAAAGAGAWFESYLAAGLAFGIAAMVVAIAITLWRRK